MCVRVIAATSQEVPHSKRTSNKVRGGDSLKSWLRPEVPERRSMRLMISDEKAAVDTYFTSIMDSGSDSDEEYLPNEDWKEVGLGGGEGGGGWGVGRE